MEQTYLFSKETRDEHFDTDTSYAFRLRIGRGWLHLNKKATKLIEHDDHLEVKLADWYINVGDKFIGETVVRQERCNDLQEEYYELRGKKYKLRQTTLKNKVRKELGYEAY